MMARMKQHFAKGALWGMMALLLVQVAITHSLAADVVREVTGFGVTKEEAVINGLLEAVQQVKGVKVDALKEIRSTFSESARTDGSGAREELSLASDQQQRILSKTQGLIKTYEILKYNQRPGRGWEAQLRVVIPSYEAVGLSPENRRKLGVMPFRAAAPSFAFGGLSISSGEASQRVTQGLVTQFSQSRRFTVLDREFSDEYLSEKNLLLSSDAPLDEQVKLGNVLGVDYMVVGTIKDAGFEQYAHELKLTGQVRRGWTAHGTIDYRIILMATRQVKWANTLRVELDSQEAPEIGDLPGVRDALFEKVAREVAAEALGNIYPIRIVSFQENGEYILNQGGSGLVIGDLYDVFSPGEKIVDPYTKESLGHAEKWVAQLEITRVTPKMSYARLVDGEPLGLKEGSICRKKNTDDSKGAKVNEQKPHARGPAEGIRLPFD